jgi:hypothetical protein
MIGNNAETMSWRDSAMTRATSSAETRSASAPGPVVEFRKASLETAAWDPYEVWLTRVKQPRDARKK